MLPICFNSQSLLLRNHHQNCLNDYTNHKHRHDGTKQQKRKMTEKRGKRGEKVRKKRGNREDTRQGWEEREVTREEEGKREVRRFEERGKREGKDWLEGRERGKKRVGHKSLLSWLVVKLWHTDFYFFFWGLSRDPWLQCVPLILHLESHFDDEFLKLYSLGYTTHTHLKWFNWIVYLGWSISCYIWITNMLIN